MQVERDLISRLVRCIPDTQGGIPFFESRTDIGFSNKVVTSLKNS